MQLKRVVLKEYKNLKDFELIFNGEASIDVLIGKNGSGKSNLFEALIEIFEALVDERPSFDFELDYEIEKEQVSIRYVAVKEDLFLNDKLVKKINTQYLPDNILIYYSGHNPRIEKLLTKYENAYRKRIRERKVSEFRLFFGLSEVHKKILLLINLLSDHSHISENIKALLKIDSFDQDIKFILKKPFYFKDKLNSWDEKKYWGVEGYLVDAFKQLTEISSKSDRPRPEGYFFDRDEFIFYVNTAELKKYVRDVTPIRFLQFLDDLRILEMLSDIDFSVNLEAGKNITLNEFSDGEVQTILFNGILELFSNNNCVMLLDEPDAFLHPEWQFSLLKNIFERNSESVGKFHILLNTHNASTLVSSKDKQINLLEFDGKTIVSIPISKKEAVTRLTEGFISLSEDETKLKIDTVIKDSPNPVLFTEGITDEKILDTAWDKLYPGKDKKFIIHNAFSCGFLRTLLKAGQIFKNYPQKYFFALFDFDKAYNDWNQLSGDDLETNPYKGLSRTLSGKNCSVFLLPVPKHPDIKKQVIKNEGTSETFKGESQLTIELLFYGLEETKDYYEKESCAGGGCIFKFRGNKVKFADQIVPTLPSEAFHIFKPIFKHVEAKCK